MQARLAPVTAFVALAIVLAALPIVASSNSGCRFVGSPTQDYEPHIDEPGNTAGILAFTVAPLAAAASLILLVRVRRQGSRPSRLAVAAAILVFPLALVNFLVWGVSSASGCGTPLL
jgi:hypothetical protein